MGHDLKNCNGCICPKRPDQVSCLSVVIRLSDELYVFSNDSSLDDQQSRPRIEENSNDVLHCLFIRYCR